jgi:rare lipoprotein A
MGVFHLLVLLGLLFLSPLFTASGSPSLDLASQRPTYRASWYGHQHHGRETASGESFDMTGLTAAHRDLPFGTRLQVTLVKTGRQVVVTINDRGPFIEGRDLDLSYAAARQLGMVEAGLAAVYIDPLSRPSATAR